MSDGAPISHETHVPTPTSPPSRGPDVPSPIPQLPADPNAALESLARVDQPPGQVTAQPEVQQPNQQDIFTGHAQEFAAKHAAEVRPLETGPFTVAIVSRVYRELSNGNFTEQLISLVTQKIPSQEVRAYFAINNTRLHALAGEVWLKEQKALEDLPEPQRSQRMSELVEQARQRHGIDHLLTDGHARDVPLAKRARDFLENQATLSILRALTTAGNALSTQSTETHTMIIQQALQEIRNAANGFLSDAQIRTLQQASSALLRRGIRVMGIDCSSLQNAYPITNQGQATNEAAHMAIAQGAKYIDVIDMDEFHSPTALQEIVGLAQTSNVDVLTRPLTVHVFQHPEQMGHEGDVWATLIRHYSESQNRAYRHYGELDRRLSGTLIVSSKAFRRHEYPHQGYAESDAFAESMVHDPSLRKRYAQHSDLQVDIRGRDVSWFGANLGVYPVNYASDQEIAVGIYHARGAISDLTLADQQILRSLRSLGPSHADYVSLYEEQRRKFFQQNMAQRVQQRRIFLGVRANGLIVPNAILPRVYAVWQEHPEWNADQIVQAASLRPRQRAFLDQNPLLLPGVLAELQRIQAASTSANDLQGTLLDAQASEHQQERRIPLTLSAISQHIATSLPDLFGLPLLEEPTYDPTEISSLSRQQVNFTNWAQLFQAARWLKAYILDLQEDGQLPQDVGAQLVSLANAIR